MGHNPLQLLQGLLGFSVDHGAMTGTDGTSKVGVRVMEYDRIISPAKLEMPLLSPRYVPRIELQKRLKDVFQQRLTCVVAPIGYGKTSALVEFANNVMKEAAEKGDPSCGSVPYAAGGSPVVSWLELDERDNDPRRFWLHVFKALGILDSLELGELSIDDDLLEAAAAVLYDEESVFEGFLFIDDFDVISNSEIESGLITFLQYTPRDLHLVVSASEISKHMMLGSYALGQYSIDATDLAFSKEESDRFMDMRIEEPDADRREEYYDFAYALTEGWPQGLFLAARTESSSKQKSAELRFNGNTSFVKRFFSACVEPAVDEDTLSFMLSLSVLEKFNMSLCLALFGESCARKQLPKVVYGGKALVVSCDEEEEWFRFNFLFADWLRSEALKVPGEELRGLCLRASEWFHDHDYHNEAAKYLLMTVDFEYIENTVFVGTGLRRQRTEVSPMVWLGRTPADRFPDSPLLCMLSAWAYNACGRIAEALDWTRLFEKAARNAGIDEDFIDFAARCMEVKCKTMTIDGIESRKCCEELLEGGYRIDPSLMSMFYQSLGEAYERSGEMKQAEEMFLQAQASASIHKMPHQLYFNMLNYAELQYRRGKFGEVEELCSRILAECPDDFVFVGAASSLLAQVYIEINRMESAEACVEDAIKRCSAYRNADLYLEAKMVQASLLVSQERLSDAYEAISEGVMRCEHMEIPRAKLLMAYFKQATISKLRHNMRELRIIEKKYSEIVDDSDRYRHLLLKMINAYVLEEAGDLEAASDLYAEVADSAKGDNLILLLVKAQIAGATLFYSLGDTKRAIGLAGDLMSIAKAYGFVRSFIDAEKPMTDLLKEYSTSRHAGPAVRRYMKHILMESDKRLSASREFNEGEPFLASSASDVLSSRESEVMHLLDMGLTRKEISETLHISINTTKKHLSNIYGKLGVTTRDEAIEAASKEV